ncbi:MAG TPA: 2-hydroxyacid dehydrogenase [Thermomicrobiales bacterium]
MSLDGRSTPDRPVSVLVIGDRFVLNSLLVDALREELGPRLELIREPVELPWPVEPFGDVAEVHEACGSEEEMLALVPGAEVIVTEMAPITERVLQAADRLKLIVVCRGGPVNVNLAAATERGIPVCFTPGRNAAATAEYTIGLMLSALRWIPFAHGELKEGRWRGDFYAYDQAGEELEGKRVGLVGFGAVGRRVARILLAFGAEVMVTDPMVTPEAAAEAGVRWLPLAEMLPQSEVLSLHARLTPETRGMIGAKELSALPRGAVVVNSARGALLDADALCDALESGHLRAAALDVYDPEPPPPSSRLFRAPRLVLSPHIGGATRETAERAARQAAEEVGRFARGEALAWVANAQALASTRS